MLNLIANLLVQILSVPDPPLPTITSNLDTANVRNSSHFPQKLRIKLFIEKNIIDKTPRGGNGKNVRIILTLCVWLILLFMIFYYFNKLEMSFPRDFWIPQKISVFPKVQRKFLKFKTPKGYFEFLYAEMLKISSFLFPYPIFSIMTP